MAPPSAVRDLKAVRRKSFVVCESGSLAHRLSPVRIQMLQVHGIVWAQERLGWRLIALRRWRARFFFADSSQVEIHSVPPQRSVLAASLHLPLVGTCWARKARGTPIRASPTVAPVRGLSGIRTWCTVGGARYALEGLSEAYGETPKLHIKRPPHIRDGLLFINFLDLLTLGLSHEGFCYDERR